MTTADRRVEATAKAMYDDIGSSLTDARLFTWGAATEAVRADWRRSARTALLAADAAFPARSEYDAALGKITAEDREYAAELLHDVEPGLTHGAQTIENVAQWFRKVRYEAVMADRKVAASPASGGEEKDEAYRQRNHLVAALARLFPSGIRPTNIEGWDPEWHGCVLIDLPSGQISYHYHDNEAHLFADLPPYTKDWDGHDKAAVHKRLAELGTFGALSASPAPAVTEEWQPIETAPKDGRRIWVSDGKDVWHIMAHKDGSHKQAPLCKFWMDARWPAPPTMIRGDRD